MRRVLLALHLTTALLAADPPYFIQPIPGTHAVDLFQRYPAEFNPGTLSRCTELGTGLTYRSWDCQLVSASLDVQVPGKKTSFAFSRVYISEYQTDPNSPSSLSYSYQGAYQETLASGALLEMNTSFAFARSPSAPKLIRGSVNSNVGMNIGLFIGLIP